MNGYSLFPMPLILEEKSADTHVLRSVVQVATPADLEQELQAAARLAGRSDVILSKLQELYVSIQSPKDFHSCSRDVTRAVRQGIFEVLASRYVLLGTKRLDRLMDDHDVVARAKGERMHWETNDLMRAHLRDLIEIEGGPCSILGKESSQEIRLVLVQMLTDIGLYDPLSS